jgi:stearoyl-CoA desaturase (delta-9 desaturase)
MQQVDGQTNPCEGAVYWKASKSLWYTAIVLASISLAPLTITPGAVAVCFVLTVTTLCLGHTLGMHRRLIHESYQCPLWLEYGFVYLGVLVGIAGPFRIIYMHDIRDWSQRFPSCHSFFIHTNGWRKDFYQQMHCDIRLTHPPRFEIEDRVKNDRFYGFLQKTWMLQQLPLAAGLYWLGGWSWVVWGSGVRLVLSLTGHWLVGYLAHNRGRKRWHIEGAAVQGFNVRGFALLTMGESWHNNHHAYPESARLGIKPGELDLGWLVLSVLQRVGFVWNVVTPEKLPERKERIELAPSQAQPNGNSTAQ